MFGLWYEVIIGKLITMAYQLNFLVPSFKINKFYPIWTDNPDKMLTLKSLDGSELLMLAGFIQLHYLFSVIFGTIAHCIERTIASLLIDNYETNTQLYIPVTLTCFTQFFAISTSYAVLFDKANKIVLFVLWSATCIVSLTLFFWLKRTNEIWLKEMENIHRKRIFTVSQRFQVKENLRALKLGKRLVFSVLGTMIIGGIGILLVILELIPQSLCHFVENCIFLNPLWVCPMFMYSLPAWKEKFKKSFPSFPSIKRERKLGVVNVEPVEEAKKRISLETNVHFDQLNKFWI